MLTAGDEDFRAAQAVGTVRLFDCARFHQAQIGAAMRLGQTHGAAPFARHHLRHDVLLHPVRAGGGQCGIGCAGQTRIHRERLVGRNSHLGNRHGQHDRQTGTAKGLRCAQAVPARLAIGFVSVLESLRRAHHAVFEMAAFFIAALVQRLQHFFGKLRRVGQNVVHQIGRHLLELRQIALLFQLQKFGDEELYVIDRGAIARHGCNSSWLKRQDEIYGVEGWASANGWPPLLMTSARHLHFTLM